MSVGVMVSLGSCHLAKNQLTYDRAAELDRQDYRDGLAPVPAAAADTAAIPDFQPVLSTPEELRLPSPLVTVSVNQTVGLRDLIFELSRQAGVDIELDPQIHGSIIFTAKNRPFNEVVDRICSLAGLRYKFQDNVLRIELDRPYIKSYNIDYLNMDRKGDSKINTSISVSGGGGSTAGNASSGNGGGSSSSVTGKFEPDLWKDLQTNVEHILSASDTYISLATTSDPVTTPVNPNPPPAPAAPATAAGGKPTPPPPPLPGSPQVAAMPAAAAPTLNITPVSEPTIPSPPATFSMDREAGTLTIFASERQQRQVAKYLDQFRKAVSTQVLIEAKVLEVDLSDEYAAGIDWGTLNLTGLAKFTLNNPIPALSPPLPVGDVFGGVFNSKAQDGGFKAALQLISRFGTTRALSSPRVTVLNNQPAIVNVAKSIVYFTYTVTPPTTSTAGNTPPTVNSTINSVPEGVLLNVLPRANPDTGEIYLSVRPTVTKIDSFVTDPTTTLIFALDNIVPPAGLTNNQIPQVSIQEMDSLVKLQSGQIMVMGGLMKDQNQVADIGAPVLSDLPLIGNLFKNHQDSIQKSELVIFLRAQIVPGSSNVEPEDRKIYNTFSLDRRPAKL